jgi:hypothetical protein
MLGYILKLRGENAKGQQLAAEAKEAYEALGMKPMPLPAADSLRAT